MSGEPCRPESGARTGRRVGTHLVAVRSPVRRTVAPLAIAGVALLCGVSGCVGRSARDDASARSAVPSSIPAGLADAGNTLPERTPDAARPLPTDEGAHGEPLPTAAPSGTAPLPTSPPDEAAPLPTSSRDESAPLPTGVEPGRSSLPVDRPPGQRDAPDPAPPAPVSPPPTTSVAEPEAPSDRTTVPSGAGAGSAPPTVEGDASGGTSPSPAEGGMGDQGDGTQACSDDPVVTVLFRTDDATLGPVATGEVAAVLPRLRESTARIDIVGHADRRTTDYPGGNDQLSEDRAHAVERWLTQHGIDPGRVHPEGRGTRDPLPETAGVPFAKERRAEVFLRCSPEGS